MDEIAPLVREYCGHFGFDPGTFLEDRYLKVTPASSRPFASKYTWEV
jgi:hypothetical protein